MRNILATFFLFCLTMAVIGQAAEQIPSANLRFSHKTHTQNSISCITCHVDREPTHNTDTQAIPPGWQPLRNTKIVASSSGVFSQKYEINDKFGRPGEKRCLECHFKSREKSDCGLCHLEKPGPTARTRKRLDADFVFAHNRHQKFECSRCHPAVPEWEKLDGQKINSDMEDCLVCHNGKNAVKNCVICHTPTPRPTDHTRHYEKKHGVAYRTDPHHCQICHEDSSCVKCHSQKPRDHTLAWVRHRHGIASKTNPQKCQACHSDPWVCKRCHNNR